MNNKNIHIDENKILLNKTKLNKGEEKLNNELINYRYDDNNQKNIYITFVQFLIHQKIMKKKF